jgi:DNA-binding NtrC family response regulator
MSSIRVLIVDDEPDLALTLAAALEKLHDEFIVDTACDFAAAISTIKEIPYALLISEHKMRDLNGLDLARAVSRISPDTQIVLMTSQSSPDLQITVDLLGFLGCLDKPFSLAQIRELLLPIIHGASTIRRVLVFDRDKDLLHLHRDALWRAGYKLYEATTIDATREFLAQRPFDAFLCVIGSAGMDIVHLLRHRIGHLNQLGSPTVVVSAESGYRSICENMGIEFYLETPVATGTLVTLLDRLTEKR